MREVNYVKEQNATLRQEIFSLKEELTIEKEKNNILQKQIRKQKQHNECER